jgi:hypothetical protein
MTVSLDSEKAFDKIQYPFSIKALNKLGIEGTYLNIIKTISDKLIINIILNREKQTISSKIRNETRVSILVDRAMRQEKEGLGTVVHDYNPSFLGGEDREDCSLD